MSHVYYHAISSARLFGGTPEDYLHLHDWIDETKSEFADFRHRAVRHHHEGISLAVELFGAVIINSDRKPVSVRAILEQHCREDMGGRVPHLSDWLGNMTRPVWIDQPASASTNVRPLMFEETPQ